MINLKNFENMKEYNRFIPVDDMEYISYIENTDKVHICNINEHSNDYLTFIAKSKGTFVFAGIMEVNKISYSLDNGRTWSEPSNNVSITVNKRNKVMWKGEMTPYTSETGNLVGIGFFDQSSAEFDIRGNIMSLLYGDEYRNVISLTGKDYAFCGLFANTEVINARNLSLPATTLSVACYMQLFYNCTKLKATPVLPAETLAVNCYKYMFSNCTLLKYAPALNSVLLADSCYCNMFDGCTSLEIMPDLPATVLQPNAYSNMFSNCISLKTSSVLYASTLVQDCYKEMFKNCITLNNITALFTTEPSDEYTKDWVYNVSETGVFSCSPDAEWDVTGTNGIPADWVKHIYNENNI